jgi:hypothetical protein
MIMATFSIGTGLIKNVCKDVWGSLLRLFFVYLNSNNGASLNENIQ